LDKWLERDVLTVQATINKSKRDRISGGVDVTFDLVEWIGATLNRDDEVPRRNPALSKPRVQWLALLGTPLVTGDAMYSSGVKEDNVGSNDPISKGLNS